MTTHTENTAFETALAHAMTLHQSGEVRDALQAYEQLLPAHAQNAQLLYLIGTAQIQLDQSEAGIQNIQAALLIAPHYLAAWKNLAKTLTHLDRVSDALTCYEQVIALSPQDDGAYFARANLLSTLKRFDEAVASYAQALAQQPDDALAWNNCGLALMELERCDEALTHYDNAIRLRHDFAQAHYNKGLVLKRLQRLDEALASYDAAIAIKPDHVDAHLNRGNVLHELNRKTEALASYDAAIAIDPSHVTSYNNRGVVLQACERMNDALESYDLAISLNPEYADAYLNRGNVFYAQKRFAQALESYNQAIAAQSDLASAYLYKSLALCNLKRLDEALVCCTQAIALKPRDTIYYTNYGLVLKASGRLQEALAAYEQAIAIDPDDHIPQFNKSLYLLLLGKFDEGWSLYESRWSREEAKPQIRNFTQALWLGTQSLVGKTILIHTEQGFGGNIQFCRYVKLVHDLGAKVLLQAPYALIGLFESLDGVSQLIEIGSGSPLPDFDYYCPTLSLPLAFKTNLNNIPSPKPYLSSQPAKVTAWRQRLGPKTKPRVGLAWSGSPDHKDDNNRSLALADVYPHLPPEFDYVCLQKIVREVDQDLLQSCGMRHFGDELHDFSDTAALCELMDVVISVDTSVAHLAAAIGRPTWILLSYTPDWRWLLDREDSPWYECVKLYRQEADWRWDTVAHRIATDLRATL